MQAERLTQTPEWDTFLRMNEARLSEDRAELRAIEAQLLDPEYMDAEHVIDLRHRMARVRGRIDGRVHAMGIPREIIASARAQG